MLSTPLQTITFFQRFESDILAGKKPLLCAMPVNHIFMLDRWSRLRVWKLVTVTLNLKLPQ